MKQAAGWLIAAALGMAGIASATPERADSHGGALSGATVYLSPGHGWWFTGGRWTTQRGPWHNLVEDLSNAETVVQYLVPYLENAGARVFVTRERDFQTNMVIVEAGGPEVTLEGDWQRQQLAGTYNGDQFVARTVRGAATSRATFTPEIPEAGYYAVYAWYRPPERGRATRDAQIVIRHTGGETLVPQDQNRDTRTWKYLGTYWFDAGSDAERGAVVVENTGRLRGGPIVVDAVRFGGGMGDWVAEDGTTSGRPRWEESGLYYAQFMGLDPESSTQSFNQVRAMPRYAEWEDEPAEKGRSIYLAWHTNGSADHTMSGISTYIYGENAWGPPSDFTGFPGGDALGSAVHFRVLDAVRSSWDAEWEDVGLICRWLGETNPESNNKMPAALLENGYHDNARDAAYILDPRFRRLSARAAYHGVLSYFVDHVDGFDIDVRLPEPPTHLRVRKSGMNEVEVAWNPPPHDRGDGVLGDAATGYRVYRSRNGKGFDSGTPVSGTRVVLADFAPGHVEYIRVTATNDGGESLAGETLAISPAELRRTAPVLLVNGFDRLDRGLNYIDKELFPGDRAERGILSRMNTYDYSIQHARALHHAGFAFDACSNEAVIDGQVDLQDYKIVVWILGEESREDATFDGAERERVAAFLRGGGALFVSGAEIAWDLAGEGGTAPGFLREMLRAEFRADASGTHHVTAADEGIFAGMAGFGFEDGTGPAYPVENADVIAPAGGAVAALYYGASDQPAAIQYAGNGRVVYLAFPFETITEEAARHEIMVRAMAFLAGER